MAKNSQSASDCNCGTAFRHLSAEIDRELAEVQRRVGQVASPRLTPADLSDLAERCPQFGRIAELLDAAVRR